MQRKKLRFGKGFRVALGNKRAQAAEMVLLPKGKEGDRFNRHKGADQYLFVVSGSGKAFVNGKTYPLVPGSLLLIEHGDFHEIKNTGKTLLKTLNFYAPPAFDKSGDTLPAGKRK